MRLHSARRHDWLSGTSEMELNFYRDEDEDKDVFIQQIALLASVLNGRHAWQGASDELALIFVPLEVEHETNDGRTTG